MSTNFGTFGIHYPREQTRLIARDRSWAKGEVGLVKGRVFAGVDLTNPSAGPNGPRGSVVPVGDEGMELRLHAIQVIALEAVAQNSAGQWLIRGEEFALVKFPSNATYEDGTPLILSTVDGDCVLQADLSPTNGGAVVASAITTVNIKAKLAAQVVVTDFANAQLVRIVIEGRSGF